MAIYNGTQKIKMSGIDKIYVGTTLVYQNAQPVTITYRKVMFTGTTPATKTVLAGYLLTAEDLPTQNDASGSTTTGWTYDGTTQAMVGDAVTSDITLYQIETVTVTSANLFKRARAKGKESYSTDTPSTSVSMGNVGNSDSGSTTKTYALSQSYSRSFSDSYYYKAIALGAWGGNVINFTTDGKFRVEWTPSRYQVSFTNPSGYTQAGNAVGTYPTLVIRHEDTGGFIYSTTQNSANKISYICTTAEHSGSTIRIYIQHGGNHGGKKLAYRSAYYQGNSSYTYGYVSCNTSTTTETIYIYALPTT